MEKSSPGIANGMSSKVQHKLRSGISVRSSSQVKNTAIETVIAVPPPAKISVLRIIR